MNQLLKLWARILRLNSKVNSLKKSSFCSLSLKIMIIITKTQAARQRKLEISNYNLKYPTVSDFTVF